VLVVDDQAVCAANLADLIERAGHRAEWVTTAEQALQTLKRRPFDLVLCDWKLDHDKREGDFRLLAQIKSLRPELPVIMYSGHPLTADVCLEAENLGALIFLGRKDLLLHTGEVIQRFMREHREPFVVEAIRELRAECGLPPEDFGGLAGRLTRFIEKNYADATLDRAAIVSAGLEAEGKGSGAEGHDRLKRYRQVSDRFRYQARTTPVHYLEELRVRLAYRLVCRTQQEFTRIAGSCGYGCYRSLSDALQRKYGKRPRALRAQAQPGPRAS